jgi:hypothetical protein
MANYKKWLPNELDFIREHQLALNDETLASRLSEMSGQSVTRSMVRRQRRKMSIKKPRGRPRKKMLATNQENT